MDNIVKPWHGIPREDIDWHSEVDEEQRRTTFILGFEICRGVILKGFT
jgi:hypothetical protein